LRGGAGRSWKKAISRTEDRPTSSQPAKRVSTVSERAATTMPARKTAKRRKKRW
jgi:hypothetical protein